MATKKASKKAVKKAPAKKATKKAAVKKSPAKKAVVKKSAAKKSAAKKAPAKKSASKKTSAKKSTRKYGPGASKSVEREMKAMERGKLKSGSGRKVTSRKQAIAIGLSEARKKGDKVPAQK